MNKLNFSILTLILATTLIAIGLQIRILLLPPMREPNLRKLTDHFSGCETCQENSDRNNYSNVFHCDEMGRLFSSETNEGNWRWNCYAINVNSEQWDRSSRFESGRPADCWIWKSTESGNQK